MGTVGTTALLGGLVDLDVLDNAGLKVKTLSLSVGLGVLQEGQDVLGTLNGPASLGDTMDLGLGTTANTTVETTESNSLLVLQNITKESLGLLKAHTLNGHGGFTGVLEVDTEIVSLGHARLGLVLRSKRVHHLLQGNKKPKVRYGSLQEIKGDIHRGHRGSQ